MPSNDNEEAAAKRLSSLIEGYWTTQVINAALKLGIPDLIGNSVRDVAGLAREAGANAAALDRLLRAMETLSLVMRGGDDRVSLTSLGALLREDATASMRGRGLFAANMLWHQFADLADVVRTGERARSAPPDFESMDPARLAVFQKAMAESSLKAAADAVEVYDFAGFRRLLDVGGGFGGVLAFLLERMPALTGDVYDLDLVAEGAWQFLGQAGLGARAGVIAGDFFRSVPEGYDCYLLKYILHDWDDAHALTLLRCIGAAAGPGAKLVVLEQVVPERLEDRFEHRAVIRGDLTMLTVGGKERTAAEYRALLADAGFRLTAIVPTASSFSVIEAVPA